MGLSTDKILQAAANMSEKLTGNRQPATGNRQPATGNRDPAP